MQPQGEQDSGEMCVVGLRGDFPGVEAAFPRL